MAQERSWTGFEGGDSNRLLGDPFRGSVFGDGTARTGEFHCRHLSRSAFSNTGQNFRRINTTLGTGLALNEKTRVNYRIFVKLHAQVGTSNCRGGGIGKAAEGQKGQFTFDTTGHFAVAINDVVGTYSTNALALEVWYRFDLSYIATQNAGTNCTIETSLSVYTSDGTFIETVTQTPQAVAANASLPVDFTIGNATTSSTSTFDYSFDDWFWDARDKADAVSAFAFPTATKINRVGVKAQGASAAWTGDFRTVTDYPQITTVTDEQSTSTDEATTTFAHETAAGLALGSIAGIIVCAGFKASGGAGDDALMLNGVEYTVSLTTAYTTPDHVGVDYTAYTTTQFNSMEFGARNKRGVATQLGKCYLEVLHDGIGLKAPFSTPLNNGYKHKVKTYTGNGTYQEITGIGFGSHAIMLKPINDASSLGVYKVNKMGGTVCRINGGGVDPIAVLEITSDGFKLGPSLNANESGTVYEAVCFQDGGPSFFLDANSYIGDSADGRDIVLTNAFQPDWTLVFGPNQPVLRTKEMTGDFSLSLNSSATTTNLIQAFNTNGFEVGTDAFVNGGGAGGYGIVYSYVAIKIPLTTVFATGKVTPAGTTFTVTGVPFAPFFVTAKRQAAVNAFFRASDAHAGANSTPWPGGVNDVNGITSLTADGFTGGSQVSAAGVDTYWFAMSGTAATSGDFTGVYRLEPGKLNDTLYDRTVSPVGTTNAKIPDPFIKSGLFGG